jgi:hypothetical protein
VVRIEPDATIYGEPAYVALAFDEVADGARARLLHYRSRYHAYLAGYQLIDLLCSDRAVRTVDETLLVEGRAITPERYLRLWRTALAEALSAPALEARHGLKVVAVLEGVLEPLRGARASWTDSPFRTFDDFVDRHAPRIQRLAEGRFRVEFDLSEAHGARDAYYGSSFLSGAADGDGPWRSTLVVRGAARGAQPGLFNSPAVEA